MASMRSLSRDTRHSWSDAISDPIRCRYGELEASSQGTHRLGGFLTLVSELDSSVYPREEWVLVGPFDGVISPGYTDSYVHLGVLGAVDAWAVFDDVSVRRYE